MLWRLELLLVNWFSKLTLARSLNLHLGPFVAIVLAVKLAETQRDLNRWHQDVLLLLKQVLAFALIAPLLSFLEPQ